MRSTSIVTTAVLTFLACGDGGGGSGDTGSDSDTGTTTAATPTSTASTETTTASTETTDAPPLVGVTVRRTTHGLVHVTADDLRGLAYGVGYAFAADNRCLLAHRLAEVEGRLSAQLGADAEVTLPVHGIVYTALESDRFYRGWYDDAAIEAGFAAGSPEVLELAEGYAAGVERRLAEDQDPVPCPVEFAGPVRVENVLRMWVATAGVASGEVLAAYLAGGPPNASNGDASLPSGPPLDARRLLGSNAWAIGRDGGQDGRGVHLYNPHFPWTGIHRLYLVHLTIPGELDVMGAALGGFPLPAAGFNEHVAWGLTFSAAARFTVAALPLVPDDPMTYTVDDQPRKISEELLAIEVAGEDAPRQVPFYRAGSAPLLDAPDYFLGWSDSQAFAVHDVNADNTRMVEQLLGLARASSVAELRDSLAAVQGVPWSYTLALDEQGDVFFGDISNVPAVTAALLGECPTAVTPLLRPFGIHVLDGGRSACEWSGRLSVADLPALTRSDYVANSNNNHELPNLSAPLAGYSPILGEEDAALSLRASLGLGMIEERLAGGDGLGEPGFTGPLARDVFRLTRNRAGELLADEIAADCLAEPTGTWDGAEVDLTEICATLAGWDRRNGVGSVGALVFAGLWASLADTGELAAIFAAPADRDDPLGTPSGYSPAMDTRVAVRNALARVQLTLADRGVPVNAPWGDVNAVLGPEGPRGVPGGQGSQGVFDVIESAAGYGTWSGWADALEGVAPPDLFGASYVHLVTFGPDGPEAEGLLAYSQATELDSPWYMDQLDAYAQGEWFMFPFSEAAITADPNLTQLDL